MPIRTDETWHRLREWTYGQALSERLAAQLLHAEGYKDVDPSHPLGGPDGGKDVVCRSGNEPSSVAVYFPRGQQTFSDIRDKCVADGGKAAAGGSRRMIFITNQELTLSERAKLASACAIAVEIFHIERIAAILDRPDMAGVRKQFLHIGDDAPTIELGGQGGQAPGAGGGGGGAIGRGARGGDGGGGGQIVDEIIDLASFGEKVPHHINMKIGRGGEGGPPGCNGEAGEGTVAQICAEDGTVLRELTASGGRPGARGGDRVEIPRQVTGAEMAAGFRLLAMMPAEVVLKKDGLFQILFGGWYVVHTSALPFHYRWSFAIILYTDVLPSDETFEIVFELRDGAANVVGRKSLGVKRDDRNYAVGFDVSSSALGVWDLIVLAGQVELGRFPIMVERQP